MEQSKTTLDVSPLLGISEPNLLLEGLNQRIAFLEHRLQTGCFANENLEVNMASVLKSFCRERDELMAALARVAQFQMPPAIVIAKAGEKP